MSFRDKKPTGPDDVMILDTRRGVMPAALLLFHIRHPGGSL
jgi:hypothetical protein